MVHVSNEEISGGVPLLCLVPSSTLTLSGQQDISYLSPTTIAVRRSTSTTTTLSLETAAKPVRERKMIKLTLDIGILRQN